MAARRAALLAVPVLAGGCGASGGPPAPAAASGPAAARAAAPVAAPVRLVVRRRVVSWVDRRRVVRRNDGSTAPRRVVTVVRYPEVTGGTAADRARRFPLVVFAHGYALGPRDYRPLLLAWARAGFVVAAPVLPGESAGAPGGPNRADLPNEPGDLRFVLGRLTGPSSLAARIDPSRVAVAGHSDGGDAALAVAYDARYRSRRVGAAVILAGADLPGIGPFRFPRPGPPLLAVQGTADTVNPPAATDAYYDRARVPRFRLTLLGAGHYDPYMSQRPQVRIVARTSIAFLRRSLEGAPISRADLARIGTRAGVSTLRAGG